MARNLGALEGADWRQLGSAIRQELGSSRSEMSTALSLLIFLGLMLAAALAAAGLWMIFSWLVERAAIEIGGCIVDFMRQLTGR